MRLVRTTFGLLVVSFAAISVAVVLVCTLHPEAACLLYDTRDDQGGDVRSINLVDGTQYVYYRGPAQLPALPLNGDVNGNGRSQIYLTGSRNGPHSLYVDPKPLRGNDGYIRCLSVDGCWIGDLPPHSAARLVTNGIQQHFIGAWLDNERFIYSLPTDSQNQTLVIESLDGATKYTLPTTFSQNDKITIGSLDTPLIFLVNQVDIYVWYETKGRLIVFPGTTNNQNLYPRLSPQGNYLTLSDNHKLIILSTETQARTELPLPSLSPGSVVTWSPDEKYFIYSYRAAANQWNAVLYSLDGLKISNIDGSGFWSKDSHTYYFLNHIRQPADLVAVRVDDDDRQVILQDVVQKIDMQSDEAQVLIWRDKDGLTIGTLNLDTKAINVVSNKISQIGSIQLLNNGRQILYTVGHGDQYSTEVADENGSNHILLFSGPSMGAPMLINAARSLLYFAQYGDTFDVETINLDGTDRRTLATGMETIYSMDTWKDNRYLDAWNDSPDLITLRAKRNGSFTAEIILPQTGVHRILADGLASIDNFTPDAEIRGVRFFWQNAAGDDGVDGFTLDGQRVYHVTFPGHHYPGTSTVFSYLLSPDKRIIAVLERDPAHLYFMATDGSWRKTVGTEFGPSASQAWSPDGKQFAFEGSDSSGEYISIVDQNGQELLHVSGLSKRGRLSWNHCEY